jgi:predicted ester cyclase
MTTDTNPATMSVPTIETDDNKAIVRRFIEEIFVRGRKESVDELLDDEFVAHTWPSTTGNPKDDLKAAIDRAAAGLSDARFTVDDLIAEGDQVAARLATGATQTGEFMGMAATGKRYEIEEIHWFRLRDGKVVEHWHQFDQVGLMKQLGAMPGASGAKANSEPTS